MSVDRCKELDPANGTVDADSGQLVVSALSPAEHSLPTATRVFDRLKQLLGPAETERLEQRMPLMNTSDNAGASVDLALSILFGKHTACVEQVRPHFFDNVTLTRLLLGNNELFVRRLGKGRFGT